MTKTDTSDKLSSIADKSGHRKSLIIDNEYQSSEDESIKDKSSISTQIELSDSTPSDSQLLTEEISSSDTSASTSELRSRKKRSKKRTSSDSTVTIDGLIVDVGKREKILLKRSRQLEKKPKTDTTKYLSRFNDITFKTKSSTIFESNEFYETDFFGFYVLFWLSTGFIMLNSLVHIYFENTTPFWQWTTVKLLRKDLFKVALVDSLMFATSFLAFDLQWACKKGYVTWKRFGWWAQGTYDFFYLFFWLWIPSKYCLDFPWIAKIFLVLHSLVLIMKMHSYAFYNGYLWSVYNEGLFSEDYLEKLNNDEVKLPEGHDLEKTKKILRESIAFTKYELEYQAHATSEDAGHIFDKARIDIPFDELEEDGLITFPNNITLHNFFEFSMYPTLVYTLNFPRTERIRWSYAIGKILGIFGIIFLMITIAENSLYPVVLRCEVARTLPAHERVIQYFLILIDMIPPFFMEYILTFFLIWDEILNAIAELSRFADRDFYGPWWSCVDFSEFANQWNRVVHKFLLRHVYHSSISAFNVDKKSAAIITFLLSSLVHELAMYVIFGTLRGYLLLFQMSQIPLIIMSRSKFMRGKKVLGNAICWVGFISGPSIICTLYLVF
ncbi:ARE2 Sterol O-acyltransferase 2 [Candida maltosa Xu316]|uniref:O-acyltransferase n=1 Tax=Candida maltosa (strain Xu316) TaxID=1245528 RepID=M3JXR1_CANMX|nr:Sterol O-acyltransferase 2 [Candida maltosa Xu316]